MATKKQHFVPRVYMKAWERTVETNKEPDNKFKGIYIFEGNSTNGEGKNRKTVLWKAHIYTVGFKYSFIGHSCPKICDDFVSKIYGIMRDKKVYAILEDKKIKNINSIKKYLQEIEKWEFYYDDGNLAKTEAILNQIKDLNSYVLEDSLDKFFETKWERIRDNFINAVQNGINVGGTSKIINEKIAIEMLSTFFIMLCRNPRFDAMGIYNKLKNNVLLPIFNGLYINDDMSEQELEDLQKEKTECVEVGMRGIWYSELYKIFYNDIGGFYHRVVSKAIEGCQMILYEVAENECSFITSDNPAFEYISFVTRENTNGFVFPITPKYLLYIVKGTDAINIVAHKYADMEIVKRFNKMIKQYKTDTLIAYEKNLNKLL